MADITGYLQLGLVGFTDKGDYAAGNTYMMNDLVHYQNSVWRCKADQTSGVTPGENNNWTIFVNGTNDLNAIIAADVQGLLGEAGVQGVNAQNLINAIAEKVATKVLMKTDLVSQIVNDATKAASMAALYAVNEKIGDVENLPNSAEDVVAAIVQQNSNFEMNIINITPDVGINYESFGGCYAVKIGRLVNLHIGLSGLTANTLQNAISIPNGYRPFKSPVAGAGIGGNNKNFSHAQIYSSGLVSIISEDTYAIMDVFYFTE